MKILGFLFSRSGPTRRKSQPVAKSRRCNRGQTFSEYNHVYPSERRVRRRVPPSYGARSAGVYFQVTLVRARRRHAGQSISGPERPFPNVALCKRPDPGRQTISEFNLSRFGCGAYPRSSGWLARESGRGAAFSDSRATHHGRCSQPVQVALKHCRLRPVGRLFPKQTTSAISLITGQVFWQESSSRHQKYVRGWAIGWVVLMRPHLLAPAQEEESGSREGFAGCQRRGQAHPSIDG